VTDICVPLDLWEDDSEGVLATWFFADGERVSAGDIVAEVMVDKASFEITAPEDGTLTPLVGVDDPVQLGGRIARVDP